MPKPSNGFATALIVEPGKKADLHARDPGDTLGWTDKDQADRQQDANVARIAKRQDVLWADNRRAVLIVLQGMDTSGKDGTVRHLFTGVNPAGCKVVSFGVPSKEELDHHYLWRVQNAVPSYGQIGVFNRSHYESVLVERVHALAPKDRLKDRYRQINDFEQLLVENGYLVLKFMLHISKDEQRRRLQERLDDPTKTWKMNLADLKERERWGEYQAAYEDALSKCSTALAPWYVVPADKKWFRNLAISQIVADALDGLELDYPKAGFDVKKVKVE